MKGSLTATISISGCSTALRKTIRPMRPKPLMPTLMGAMLTDLVMRVSTMISPWVIARGRGFRRSKTCQIAGSALGQPELRGKQAERTRAGGSEGEESYMCFLRMEGYMEWMNLILGLMMRVMMGEKGRERRRRKRRSFGSWRGALILIVSGQLDARTPLHPRFTSPPFPASLACTE